MRRLDGTLGHRVRHEEEVERAVDHLGLLDEAVVDVGALRRVRDARIATAGTMSTMTLLTAELEEPLTHALVHDDQRGLR